ncbi:MAG: oxidoreductase [Pedobacter sp.]|nr:oxidoreductase [Pedobacter sp.]
MRGLSVVNDSVAWVSGSNGFVGTTINRGASWTWIKVKGYEKIDFRDIEAFNTKEAVVVSAGSPAYILTTNNGGKTWRENYKNTDSAIFLDGLGFWTKTKGIIFGDPIAHKMQLLTTENGSKTWQNISDHQTKNLAEGEAGFAASGTSIKTLENGIAFVATGGTVSNIYRTDNYGKTWSVFKCPILQGESTTGPFSIDFYDKNTGVVVGGNYVKDRDSTKAAMLTYDGGKTWSAPASSVKGFRSAVTYISKDTLIATGTSGIDMSLNGGKNWKNISEKSFNAVQKAKDGNLILLAGEKGRIYQLISSQN